MRILAALLLTGCAAQHPSYTNPPPMLPPVYFTPYQAPAPYQMPQANTVPPAPVRCITRTIPGMSGPQIITDCR